MDESQMKKLLEAARAGPEPVIPATFARRVVSSLKHSAQPEAEPGLLDAFASSARRFLVPAVLVILLAAAVEWGSQPWPSDRNDLAQLTEEWIFYGN